MAKSDRGFASMDDNKKRSIQSKGGKTSAGKNLTLEARIKGGKVSKRGKASKDNQN